MEINIIHKIVSKNEMNKNNSRGIGGDEYVEIIVGHLYSKVLLYQNFNKI